MFIIPTTKLQLLTKGPVKFPCLFGRLATVLGFDSCHFLWGQTTAWKIPEVAVEWLAPLLRVPEFPDRRPAILRFFVVSLSPSHQMQG